jgi:hypothetical protein
MCMQLYFRLEDKKVEKMERRRLLIVHISKDAEKRYFRKIRVTESRSNACPN